MEEILEAYKQEFQSESAGSSRDLSTGFTRLMNREGLRSIEQYDNLKFFFGNVEEISLRGVRILWDSSRAVNPTFPQMLLKYLFDEKGKFKDLTGQENHAAGKQKLEKAINAVVDVEGLTDEHHLLARTSRTLSTELALGQGFSSDGAAAAAAPSSEGPPLVLVILNCIVKQDTSVRRRIAEGVREEDLTPLRRNP